MISKDGLTHHISAQFNAELEDVRSHLLAMGGLVEKQVNDAVTALIEADSGLAQQVREVDEQIIGDLYAFHFPILSYPRRSQRLRRLL